MRPTPKNPPHPGEILLEEFLRPMEISQKALAERLGITQAHVNEIVKGKRGISPATAWLLAQAFGTSPELWLNLQSRHDLAHARPRRRVRAFTRAAAGREPAARPPSQRR